MKSFLTVFVALFLAVSFAQAADDHIVYKPKDGPGGGKHIVFLCGDEEYRGEGGCR